MWDNHFLQQLHPREWAALVLQGARDGEPVSPQHVNRALQITGDLPKTFHTYRITYEKPFPPSLPG